VEVIPAIDLRGGRCVRLYQGDYAKETVYSDNPLEVALRWQEMGAPRIHVVDLDGAASGKPENLAVLKRLADSVDVALQVGGGIREMSTCEKMLDMGMQRIVLGTVAVQEPSLVEQLCRRFGSEAVVVGVDARDGVVAIRGWQESTSSTTLDLMHRMEELGVRRFLYTDISRDGTLTEPNFQAVEVVVRGSDAAILAAGGVSSIEQLRRLASVGVEGAIVGMALYTGAIDLREAIAEV
jgi:phosphoribosylformimino-5-aminoimidazole carboxamide ribotide isomerase